MASACRCLWEHVLQQQLHAICRARVVVAEAYLKLLSLEVMYALNFAHVLLPQSHISFSSSPKGSTPQPSLLDSPLPATSASAATLSTSPASSTGSSSAAATAAAKLAAGGGAAAAAAAAALRAKGGPEALSPQDAANVMLECVYEFNACVPYAGVSAVGAGEGFGLDPLAVSAVLALLPEELQPGLPPPALAPDDVKQVSCLSAATAAGPVNAHDCPQPSSSPEEQ